MITINRSSFFCLVVLVLLLVPPFVSAQESKGAWILGPWEGKHSGPRTLDDATRFEFAAKGDVIHWKMNRKGQILVPAAGGLASKNGEWEASGIVKQISDTTVTLEGTYDSSSIAAVVGRGLSYELSGNTSSLSGYLYGANNRSLSISLQRVK